MPPVVKPGKAQSLRGKKKISQGEAWTYLRNEDTGEEKFRR